MLSTAAGFQNLLKEGFRHYAGLEEAISRNIEACKEISDKTKTSIGPNGMKKIVVNHIDKLFITSDAATMLKEIEVNHPAARMIVMAAKMQEQECGDMTNFIITFCGELLNQAQDLIKLGLHPADIVHGYELASKKALEILKSMNHYEITDPRSFEQVLPALETALCPKMPSYYKHFAKLLTEACIKILPEDLSFDLEHIRIVKIIGGGLLDSHLVNGMVIERPPITTITHVENAKIACYNCPFDISGGETKGTVLIKNAADLLNFSKSEESLMEQHIKSIADQGVKLIVVGGTISEIAIHYLEKYEIMAIRLMSKFDLMRICRCLGAVAIPQLGQPTQEELGFCKKVYIKEIGSEKVTVFEKEDPQAKLMTVVIRGATKAILEDISRSIGHGLNTYRVLLKNKVFVHGAGATEAYIANQLEREALKTQGLEQYSIARYAQSFEIIGRHLIENAGLKFNTVLPDLIAKNVDGVNYGVDVLNEKLAPCSELKVYDNLYSKIWALKLGSDVALTILRVDQIIVAKQAGGPKVKSNAGWDNDD